MNLDAQAQMILKLVADFPGRFGRLRTARIVGGYSVRLDDDDLAKILRGYALPGSALGDLVALVDAMIAGDLMTQTAGQRPTMVLTRAGHNALDALERKS